MVALAIAATLFTMLSQVLVTNFQLESVANGKYRLISESEI